jgi:hypothetical protein
MQTYTTKRAAFIGARRALEKEGVKDALHQVHFTLSQTPEGLFTFEAIDLTPVITHQAGSRAAAKAAQIEAVSVPGKANHFELNEAGKAAVKAAKAAVPAHIDAGGKLSAAIKKARAAEAIKAGKTPTPTVAPLLPIPSDNPVKDAEMPAIRRSVKLMNLPAKTRVFPRKEGSKQALLVDLLARPEGATFGELYDAMGSIGKPWQGITVRSSLPWDVNHVAGYGVVSEMFDGVEFHRMGRTYEANRLGAPGGIPGPAYDPSVKMAVYRLTYPQGMSAPLAHYSKKGG